MAGPIVSQSLRLPPPPPPSPFYCIKNSNHNMIIIIIFSLSKTKKKRGFDNCCLNFWDEVFSLFRTFFILVSSEVLRLSLFIITIYIFIAVVLKFRVEMFSLFYTTFPPLSLYILSEFLRWIFFIILNY